MDNKELELIKSLIRYSAGSGNFYRIKTNQIATLSIKNRHAIIRLTKGKFSNLYQAWKIAIYISHGYWPSDDDTCEYKDGNKQNLKLNNLHVVHFSDDETTVMDYCLYNNLDYKYVSLKMRNQQRIRRNIAGMSYWFYKKEDFKKQCKNLRRFNDDDDDNDEDILHTKKMINRKNTHFMQFLQKHILMPTRWEMTLCHIK